MKLRLPIYIAILLMTGLFFLASHTFAQENVSLGCCKTVKGKPECVGCGDGGANCAVDGSLCVETNSFTLDQICIESELAGQAECRPPKGEGCCVDAQNTCSDNVAFDACSGQHWFESTECSAVSMCEPDDSSSFTDRIIIILAIAIVIVLLILFRRKKH